MELVRNPFSGKPRQEEHLVYLQYKEYVNEITSSIYTTGDVYSAVSKIESYRLREALRDESVNQQAASEAIRITIEYGLDEIKNSLNGVGDRVDKMTSVLDDGLMDIVEQLRISNIYLGNIQALLRVSDRQKDRVDFIEEGLKFMFNAFKDKNDKRHFLDALKEFQKALGKMENDFFSLFYIGYIHLYTTAKTDVPAAEIEFRESARYFLAEANVNGGNVTRQLLPNNLNLKLKAAEAYLHAAYACHVLNKDDEAVELAREAWKTYPALSKAGLKLSKYLVIQGSLKEAKEVLQQTIDEDRILYYEALKDKHLKSDPQIIALLSEIEHKAVSDATIKLRYYINKAIVKSACLGFLERIQGLLNERQFLKATKASDLLVKRRKWDIQTSVAFDRNGQVTGDLSPEIFEGTVEELIEREKKIVSLIPDAKRMVRIKELRLLIDEMNSRRQSVYEKLVAIESEKADKRKSLNEWTLIFGCTTIFVVIIFACINSSKGNEMAIFKWLESFSNYFFGGILLVAGILLTDAILKYLNKNSEVNEQKEILQKIDGQIAELKIELQGTEKLLTQPLS